MIDINMFHSCLAHSEARGYDLDSQQREAVEFGEGLLWLLAGPGSGKSEVLVTRTLKLICVDHIEPKSIFLTTFTEKAARNLEDRLATYLSVLQNNDSALNKVDIADIRIGTLHSLCNDILQEYRYPNYQNVRLLDQIEQDLFTYRYAEISNFQDLEFWKHFSYSVKDWRSKEYLPNKWKRAKAGVTLFSRIAEDYVNIEKMFEAGGHWDNLAHLYKQYLDVLKENFRCDFSHLQSNFLEFLNSPASKQFLKGGDQNPPLRYVLVDEYQDTNPIQERIYLKLATKGCGNLTIVGDDDQALYRFRGGNVTCMVNFDKACKASFNQKPHSIQLKNNYRSHPDIVEFFNQYISSFPEMNTLGARASNKESVIASSSISGSYPAVSWISQSKAGDLGKAVAFFIKEHLLDDGIISDPSQCVLLLRSTKDSPRNAAPFIQAFEDAGIPIYNPRSKSFMDSEEVQCLIASLIQIIDQEHSFELRRDPRGNDLSWVEPIKQCFRVLDKVRNNPDISTSSLDDYLEKSNARLLDVCKSKQGQFLKLNLLEIIYRILAQEPFLAWRNDAIRNLRLSKVTRLFEGYNSFNLDSLIVSSDGDRLDSSFINRFYNMFMSYLIEAGIDDDEEEEVIVPQGYLPIMTVHQSKGLEFPFVFVAQLGQKGRVGASQQFETSLEPFRETLYSRPIREPEILSIEDDIRLLYVAYSRAQYGLLLVGTQQQIKNHVAVPERNATKFRRNTEVITTI